MQIIDVPDSARITTVRKAGAPAREEAAYMLVPASVWDDVLADHTAWQYVITPDAVAAD